MGGRSRADRRRRNRGGAVDDDGNSDSELENEYSVSPVRQVKTITQIEEETKKQMNWDRSLLLLMRSRRPVYQSFTRSYFLNFDGRVNKTSKKNVQIEYRSRLDDKVRVVLQHGAQGGSSDSGDKNTKVYSLDFTYPFSPL